MASTAPPPDDGTRRPTPDARTGSAHRSWWLAAIATFVVGLFVGGVVVALAGLGQGSSDQTSAPPSSAPDARLPSPTPSPTGAGASVQVNASCLRAVNDAQAVAQALAGLGTAVRNLDAGTLDRIVQQENVLQLRLQAEIKACHATVRLPSGSLSPTAVAPSVSPTG